MVVAVVPGVVATVVGSVALLLGLLGVYDIVLVSASSLLVLAALGYGARHALPPTGTRPAHALAAALVVVAAVLGAFYAVESSQHVLIDRDPGAYNNAARWMARDGDLVVDEPGGAFRDVDGAWVHSLAVYDEPGGLEFQFSHLLSALLAVGWDLGGPRLMFRVPALLFAAGLLPFGVLCWRVVRGRPLLLLGPILMGVALPSLFVARNSYSESLTFLLLATAVYLLVAARELLDRWAFVLGGVVLGGVVGSRPDTLVYVAPMVAVAAVLVALDRLRWSHLGAVVAGAAVPVAVSSIDLHTRSGGYSRALERELLTLGALLLASMVLGGILIAAVRRRPSVTTFVAQRRAGLAGAAGAVAATSCAVLWLRPSFMTVHGPRPNGIVRVLELREGAVAEGTRTYAEHSLEWIGRYLGLPVMVLAAAGLAIAVTRWCLGRLDAVSTFLLVVLGPATLLYLWRPTITPDHLWAMRRFVPAAVPLVVVLALIAASELLQGLRRSSLRSGASAVLFIAMLVPALSVTLPLRGLRMQDGYAGLVEDACDLLPSGSSVLVVGDPDTSVLAPALRSFCGVPAANAEVADAASVLESTDPGERPVIATFSADLATSLAEEVAGEVRSTGVAEDAHRPQPVLSGVPRSYVPPGGQLYLPVRLRVHVVVPGSLPEPSSDPVEQGG